MQEPLALQGVPVKPKMGVEPTTSALRMRCSAIELLRRTKRNQGATGLPLCSDNASQSSSFRAVQVYWSDVNFQDDRLCWDVSPPV